MANRKSAKFIRASSQCAYRSPLPLHTLSAITVEFWIKPTNVTVAQQHPLGQWGYDTANRMMWIDISTGGKLTFMYDSAGNGTGTTRFVTDDDILTAEEGEWVHLAMAVDLAAKTATFYKNANSIAITKALDAGTSIYNGTTNFVLGGRHSGTEYDAFQDGYMDEIRIWSDIRTGQEIDDNMEEVISASESGLMLYLRAENDWLDETSNNYDLTPLNSPTFAADVPFYDATYQNISDASVTLGASKSIFVKRDITAYTYIAAVGKRVGYFSNAALPLAAETIDRAEKQLSPAGVKSVEHSYYDQDNLGISVISNREFGVINLANTLSCNNISGFKLRSVGTYGASGTLTVEVKEDDAVIHTEGFSMPSIQGVDYDVNFSSPVSIDNTKEITISMTLDFATLFTLRSDYSGTDPITDSRAFYLVNPTYEYSPQRNLAYILYYQKQQLSISGSVNKSSSNILNASAQITPAFSWRRAKAFNAASVLGASKSILIKKAKGAELYIDTINKLIGYTLESELNFLAEYATREDYREALQPDVVESAFVNIAKGGGTYSQMKSFPVGQSFIASAENIRIMKYWAKRDSSEGLSGRRLWVELFETDGSGNPVGDYIRRLVDSLRAAYHYTTFTQYTGTLNWTGLEVGKEYFIMVRDGYAKSDIWYNTADTYGDGHLQIQAGVGGVWTAYPSYDLAIELYGNVPQYPVLSSEKSIALTKELDATFGMEALSGDRGHYGGNALASLLPTISKYIKLAGKTVYTYITSIGERIGYFSNASVSLSASYSTKIFRNKVLSNTVNSIEILGTPVSVGRGETVPITVPVGTDALLAITVGEQSSAVTYDGGSFPTVLNNTYGNSNGRLQRIDNPEPGVHSLYLATSGIYTRASFVVCVKNAGDTGSLNRGGDDITYNPTSDTGLVLDAPRSGDNYEPSPDSGQTEIGDSPLLQGGAYISGAYRAYSPDDLEYFWTSSYNFYHIIAGVEDQAGPIGITVEAEQTKYIKKTLFINGVDVSVSFSFTRLKTLNAAATLGASKSIVVKSHIGAEMFISSVGERVGYYYAAWLDLTAEARKRTNKLLLIGNSSLIESNFGTIASGWGVGSTWDAGQYFTPGVSQLMKVEYGIERGPAGAWSHDISLYLADGAHKPTGAALYTETVNYGANYPYPGEKVEYTFNTPWSVDPNTEYVLAWEFTGDTCDVKYKSGDSFFMGGTGMIMSNITEDVYVQGNSLLLSMYGPGGIIIEAKKSVALTKEIGASFGMTALFSGADAYALATSITLGASKQIFVKKALNVIVGLSAADRFIEIEVDLNVSATPSAKVSKRINAIFENTFDYETPELGDENYVLRSAMNYTVDTMPLTTTAETDYILLMYVCGTQARVNYPPEFNGVQMDYFGKTVGNFDDPGVKYYYMANPPVGTYDVQYNIGSGNGKFITYVVAVAKTGGWGAISWTPDVIPSTHTITPLTPKRALLSGCRNYNTTGDIRGVDYNNPAIQLVRGTSSYGMAVARDTKTATPTTVNVTTYPGSISNGYLSGGEVTGAYNYIPIRVQLSAECIKKVVKVGDAPTTLNAYQSDLDRQGNAETILIPETAKSLAKPLGLVKLPVTINGQTDYENNWLKPADYTVPNVENRCLVMVFNSQGKRLNSITFNGVAMTKASGYFYNNKECSIWYLVNPPVGTYTVNANWTSYSVSYCYNTVFTLGNVDPADPLGFAAAKHAWSQTSYSYTFQPESAGMVVASNYAFQNTTPMADQTLIVDSMYNNNYRSVSKYSATGIETTQGWTSPSTEHYLAVAEFRATGDVANIGVALSADQKMKYAKEIEVAISLVSGGSKHIEGIAEVNIQLSPDQLLSKTFYTDLSLSTEEARKRIVKVIDISLGLSSEAGSKIFGAANVETPLLLEEANRIGKNITAPQEGGGAPPTIGTFTGGSYTDNVGARNLVRTSDGTWYAAVFHSTKQGPYIWKSVDDGVTWTLDATITTDNYNQRWATLTIDDDGYLHCVWAGVSGTWRIRHSHNRSGSWSYPGTVASGSNAWKPVVTLDSNGYLQCIYKYWTTGYLIKTYNPSYDMWFSGGLVFPYVYPYSYIQSIAAMDGGDLVAARKRHSSNTIEARLYDFSAKQPWYSDFEIDQNAWQTVATVSDPSYAATNPCLAVDSNNDVHIVYQGRSATSESLYQMQYSKSTDRGLTWSTPIQLTDETESQGTPSISVDAQDNVYVSWTGRTTLDPTYTQLNQRIYSNGSWGALTKLTDGTTNFGFTSALSAKFPSNIGVPYVGSAIYNRGSSQVYISGDFSMDPVPEPPIGPKYIMGAELDTRVELHREFNAIINLNEVHKQIALIFNVSLGLSANFMETITTPVIWLRACFDWAWNRGVSTSMTLVPSARILVKKLLTGAEFEVGGAGGMRWKGIANVVITMTSSVTKKTNKILNAILTLIPDMIKHRTIDFIVTLIIGTEKAVKFVNKAGNVFILIAGADHKRIFGHATVYLLTSTDILKKIMITGFNAVMILSASITRLFRKLLGATFYLLGVAFKFVTKMFWAGLTITGGAFKRAYLVLVAAFYQGVWGSGSFKYWGMKLSTKRPKIKRWKFTWGDEKEDHGNKHDDDHGETNVGDQGDGERP